MEMYEGYNYRINIVAADSSIIVDSYTGLIKGCVADLNGNIIVDTYTSTFQGTLVGNVVGKDLTVLVDIDNNTVNAINLNSDFIKTKTIEADVVQSNITNAKDEVVFDKFHNVINNIELVESKFVKADNIHGTLTGNLYNLRNESVFDAFHNTIENLDLLKSQTVVANVLSSNFVTAEKISGNLISNLYNKNGDLVLDLNTGTFYGKLSSNENTNFSSALIIDNDCDLDDNDNFGVTVYTLKSSDNYAAGINLCRGFGSDEHPQPVTPGSKLSSIIFSAVIGNNIHNTDGIGYIGARVAEDSNISSNGFAGEFVITVKGYNDDEIEGLVVDARGHTKTVLKDFSVVGNTNQSPASNNIDSWLEVVVNGQKKFIPLYS